MLRSLGFCLRLCDACPQAREHVIIPASARLKRSRGIERIGDVDVHRLRDAERRIGGMKRWREYADNLGRLAVEAHVPAYYARVGSHPRAPEGAAQEHYGSPARLALFRQKRRPSDALIPRSGKN